MSQGLLPDTWGIGDCFGVLVVSGLSPGALEWRRGFSGLKFGLQLEHCHLNWSGIFFVGLILLSIGPSVPGRRSTNCVCSRDTFLCGMLSFFTCLTGWVDKSKFSVFLIICNVGLVIVRILIVGIWVCVTTNNIIVLFGTIRVVLGWVFLAVEMTALVSIVTWFLAVVASWFGFVWVLLCGLLRHTIYLQLMWSLQSIHFQLFLKIWHKLFICATLQMRLVDWSL